MQAHKNDMKMQKNRVCNSRRQRETTEILMKRPEET